VTASPDWPVGAGPDVMQDDIVREQLLVSLTSSAVVNSLRRRPWQAIFRGLVAGDPQNLSADAVLTSGGAGAGAGDVAPPSTQPPAGV